MKLGITEDKTYNFLKSLHQINLMKIKFIKIKNKKL